MGLATPFSATSDPSPGSVATETRYLRAPATGDHVSLSGVEGYVIVAPPTGEMSVVDAPQFFLNERPVDHGDGVPARLIARTRHQYVPFGAVSTTVARVFFVRKSSLPAPSTGELNPESAAIWNSYSEAPATGLQPKAGMPSTSAPLAGVVGTGVGGGPAAAAPTSNSTASRTTTGVPTRWSVRAQLRASNGVRISPTSPRSDYSRRGRRVELPNV